MMNLLNHQAVKKVSRKQYRIKNAELRIEYKK